MSKVPDYIVHKENKMSLLATPYTPHMPRSTAFYFMTEVIIPLVPFTIDIYSAF